MSRGGHVERTRRSQRRTARCPQPEVEAPHGHPLTVGDQRPTVLLRLQREAGNEAVHHLVTQPLQRHLGPSLAEEVEVHPGTGTTTDTGPAPSGPTEAGTGAEGPAPEEAGAEAAEEEEEPSRQDQIEQVLRKTGAGNWALGVLEDHAVDVEWEFDGTGSYFQGGKIYLNRSLSINAAAVVMMHEAQHALTSASGATASVRDLERDAYVREMIADEAEAVVRQIEGATEMEEQGLDASGGGLTSGLMEQYHTAHRLIMLLLRKLEPESEAEDLRRRARRAVRDTVVTNWFHDGTFVTSTGGISYGEHYGSFWDQIHAPPEEDPDVVEPPEPVVVS